MCGVHLMSKGKHVLGIKVSSPNLPFSLKASFFLTSPPSSFHSSTVFLVWSGRPQEGLSSLRAQSAPPHRGSLIDRTSSHCFLLLIQRSLRYANTHSGHKVETEHQLT